MLKSFIRKLLMIIVCILVILPATFVQGCTPEITVPVEVSRFSLVNVCKRMEKATGVKAGNEHLLSLYVRAGADGKISAMDYWFYGLDSKGTAKIYTVNMDAKGQMSWYSNWYSDIPKELLYRPQPQPVFAEIEKIGFSSIPLGNDGMEIDIKFQSGNATYADQKLNELKDGMLQPLQQVVFRTENCWGTIIVDSIFKEKNESLPPTRAGSFDADGANVYQSWFLGEDIAKAENVEYLQ